MKCVAIVAVALGFLAGCSGPEDNGLSGALSHRVVDEAGRVPELRCPGTPGCNEVSGPLLVGVSMRDITPVVEGYSDENGNFRFDEGEPYDDLDGDGQFDPTYIAGFGRNRPATGVHDPVWARVLVLRQGDLLIGVVSLDVIGYFHDEVIRIRKAAEQADLGFDHILVGATHNHESKDTMGLWGPSLVESGYDPDYMAFLVEVAVEALGEAAGSAEPVHVKVAVADGTGLVADSREPYVLDTDLRLMQFVRAEGSVLATWAIFSSHPETLADENLLITSDYPHYLRVGLEEHFPGSTTVFSAANLGGLMNPLRLPACPDEDGNPTCPRRSFEKAEWIGRALADRGAAALESSEAHVDPAPALAVRRKPVFATIGNIFFAGVFNIGVIHRTAFDASLEPLTAEEAKNISAADAVEGATRLQTEVNALSVGPVDIVTLPGEYYPELWLAPPAEAGIASYVEQPEGADFPDAEILPPLSTRVPEGRMAWVVNQANDALGYIIPKPQYDELSPHAYRPNGQYGEQNSLGPNLSVELDAAVRALYDL